MSSAISEQGVKGSGDGDWEFDFKPVAGVFICNFRVRFLPEKLITHVHLADMDDGESVGNYMHYVFIQANLFDKKEEECVTGFDIWMYYLKHLKTMGEIPFKSRKEQVYERLDRLSRYSAMTAEEQVEYACDLKWARDYNATLKTARREGLAEGIAEGREKGIAEGREKGRSEAKWETARNLNSMGVDIKTISAATGISEEDLKAKL